MNNILYKHLNSGFKNCTSHFTLLLYSQSYRDQATRTPYSHRALYKLHDYTRYKKCETRSKQNNRICIMAGYITVGRRGSRTSANAHLPPASEIHLLASGMNKKNIFQ